MPPLWAGIYFADISTGSVTFDLPPGPYRVVVSRGMAWSVWPPDGVPNGGFAFTAVSSQAEVIDAEIAPVVDMSGLLSVDFHVHTLSSQDSSTPHLDRIAGFIADGLDVAVSTDHDFIADYGPTVQARSRTRSSSTSTATGMTTRRSVLPPERCRRDPRSRQGRLT